MLVDVGFGHMINAHKVSVVKGVKDAPTKRMLRQAKTSGKMIDCTDGRPLASVAFLDDGLVIGSPLAVNVLAGRVNAVNEIIVTETN